MHDLKSFLASQKRTLALVESVANDPAAMEILREYFASQTESTLAIPPVPHDFAEGHNNGGFSTHNTDFAAALANQAANEVVIPPPTRGQLKKLVLETLRTTGTSLSTDMIANAMREKGFTFNTDTPTISINDALNTWQTERQVRVDHTEGRKQFWIAVTAQENVQ